MDILSEMLKSPEIETQIHSFNLLFNLSVHFNLWDDLTSQSPRLHFPSSLLPPFPLSLLILAYFLSKRLFPSSSRFLLHFLVFISTSLYLHSCFQSNNFFFQIFLLLSFPSSLLPPPSLPLFLLLYNHVQESNMRI